MTALALHLDDPCAPRVRLGLRPERWHEVPLPLRVALGRERYPQRPELASGRGQAAAVTTRQIGPRGPVRRTLAVIEPDEAAPAALALLEQLEGLELVPHGAVEVLVERLPSQRQLVALMDWCRGHRRTLRLLPLSPYTTDGYRLGTRGLVPGHEPSARRFIAGLRRRY